MDGLLDRWEAGRITSDQVANRDATRALVQMEAHPYFHVQVRGQTLSVAENQEPLEREARLDGVFILQSSAQDLDPRAVVLAYRQLLWVERAIRTVESFLRVRPVYHFTERRIRAPNLPARFGLPAGEPLAPADVAERRRLQRTGRAGGPGIAARGQLN